MTNEKLLNELLEIKYSSINEKKFLKLDKLIDEIRVEIECAEYKDLSSAQRIKKCIALSKKMSKKPHSVLQYTCNDYFNGKQAFTDTYFLAVLCDEDKLPIKDYKEADPKLNYPTINNIINKENYTTKTFTCNVGKLLQVLKANQFIRLVNEETEFKTELSYETVQYLITFLNIKSSENITFIQRLRYAETSPIYVEKKNGSFGVVMPCRMYTEIKEYKENDLQ